MKQILRDEDREVWAARLDRPFAFGSPFGIREFAVLLHAVADDVTDFERDRLAKELLGGGCRHAVCTGVACEAWHDAIVQRHLASSPEPRPPEKPTVRTSWHDAQSIEEIASHFATNTGFETFDPERFLVLQVGGDEAGLDRTIAAVLRAFEQA